MLKIPECRLSDRLILSFRASVLDFYNFLMVLILYGTSKFHDNREKMYALKPREYNLL